VPFYGRRSAIHPPRILALANQETMGDFMRKLAPTQAVTETALAGIPAERFRRFSGK
jgi:hypothetical protein